MSIRRKLFAALFTALCLNSGSIFSYEVPIFERDIKAICNSPRTDSCRIDASLQYDKAFYPNVWVSVTIEQKSPVTRVVDDRSTVTSLSGAKILDEVYTYDQAKDTNRYSIKWLDDDIFLDTAAGSIYASDDESVIWSCSVELKGKDLVFTAPECGLKYAVVPGNKSEEIFADVILEVEEG